MGAPRWCVVVVRGWIDGEDLKVRLLASGDVEGEVVCGSVASATAQLDAWLSSLGPASHASPEANLRRSIDDPGDSPSVPSLRRLPGGRHGLDCH